MMISMDDKETVKAGYNKIAIKYLASRRIDSEDVRLLDELTEKLAIGARILDAGCGAGIPITRQLSTTFKVIGIDFAEQQVKLAHQAIPNAQFACQDITELGFKKESFDAICSYYAIIHIPRRMHEKLFQRIYQLLKPLGWALLCLGAEDLEEDIVEDYMGTQMYWSHYDAETNLRLIEKCGFKIAASKVIADVSCPGSGHLFVLAQKN
jgi:SAM-dependent methyltransferase